jgi:hypothetical protein
VDQHPNVFRIACENCGATFEYLLVEAPFVIAKVDYTGCSFCGHLNEIPRGGLDELKTQQPPEMSPRNLKFTECIPFGSHFSGTAGVPDEPVTPELRSVAASLRNNFSRVSALLRSPANLVWLSRIYQEFCCRAEFEVLGGFGRQAENEEQRIAIGKRIADEWTKWVLLTRGLEPVLKHSFDNVGVKGIETLTPAGAGFMWLGLDAILTNQIIGAWTAFETLAGDLWEAALNCHPHRLSDLKGKRPKRARTTATIEVAPDPLSAGAETDKRLNLSSLQQYDYDLSEHMGTVLRYRYNFTVLDSIRDAYWQAFSKDNEDVCGAIMDESLDAIAAVRNVIVHKAGIVDQEFINKTKRSLRLSAVTSKQRLAIDGPLVQYLVEPVISQSVKLTQAVDKWLVDHPQTKRGASK